jgi:hypothetical protein
MIVVSGATRDPTTSSAASFKNFDDVLDVHHELA